MCHRWNISNIEHELFSRVWIQEHECCPCVADQKISCVDRIPYMTRHRLRPFSRRLSDIMPKLRQEKLYEKHYADFAKLNDEEFHDVIEESMKTVSLSG